jgi:hypothetical protein
MPLSLIYTNRHPLHNLLKLKTIFLYEDGLRSEEVIEIGNR